MKLALVNPKLIASRLRLESRFMTLALLGGLTALARPDSAAAQNTSSEGDIAPTINITSPTNGTVYLAPAHFTLVAEANDPDGTIVRVEFITRANSPGAQAAGKLINRYALTFTNVPVGDYTLTAVATDNGGMTGTSAPVTIHVIAQPPTSEIGPIEFNPQTGLFQQTVRVSNPTGESFDAVRIYVYGLTNATTVYNASGTNVVPFIQSLTPIVPGGSIDMMIEFYSPLRSPPNPVLVTVALPTTPAALPAPAGTTVPVRRALVLPDRTVLIEFGTTTNGSYVVEYSRDLKDWTAAQQPPIAGNGTWIQWIDNGQPKTGSAPASDDRRFYRVILLP